MGRLFSIFVAAAAVALAGSMSAGADNIRGSIRPIDVSGCPRFAQVYPDQYVFSGNLDLGGVGPGEWIAPGVDTQGAIAVNGRNRLLFTIRGLTAPGEAPQFDLSTPPLTQFAKFSYVIYGIFTGTPGTTGVSVGSGELLIIRRDGALMWGRATITDQTSFGPQWTIQFGGGVHCH